MTVKRPEVLTLEDCWAFDSLNPASNSENWDKGDDFVVDFRVYDDLSIRSIVVAEYNNCSVFERWLEVARAIVETECAVGVVGADEIVASTGQIISVANVLAEIGARHSSRWPENISTKTKTHN